MWVTDPRGQWLYLGSGLYETSRITTYYGSWEITKLEGQVSQGNFLIRVLGADKDIVLPSLYLCWLIFLAIVLQISLEILYI